MWVSGNNQQLSLEISIFNQIWQLKNKSNHNLDGFRLLSGVSNKNTDFTSQNYSFLQNNLYGVAVVKV